MYYVYILISLKDHNLYTGFTRDLKTRLKNHNDGKSLSTKGRLPTKLIYCEMYCNKKDAENREKFLKSGRGREVIHKQLNNTLKSYNKLK